MNNFNINNTESGKINTNNVGDMLIKVGAAILVGSLVKYLGEDNGWYK